MSNFVIASFVSLMPYCLTVLVFRLLVHMVTSAFLRGE